MESSQGMCESSKTIQCGTVFLVYQFLVNFKYNLHLQIVILGVIAYNTFVWSLIHIRIWVK